MGYTIYATDKTCGFLESHGISSKFVYKVHDQKGPNVLDLIKKKEVGMVFNLSDRSDLGVRELTRQTTDGYLIRRAAVDANIHLFTKATIATLFVQALFRYSLDSLEIKSYDEYVRRLR
jgi:carbamoyl-phosphate synthase large subunit